MTHLTSAPVSDTGGSLMDDSCFLRRAVIVAAVCVPRSWFLLDWDDSFEAGRLGGCERHRGMCGWMDVAEAVGCGCRL